MKRTRGKSHSGEGAKKGKQVQDARRVQQQADISVDEKKGRCDQDGSDQGSESHTRQTSHQQHGVDQKKRETAKLWSVSAGAGASEVPRVELEGLWRRGLVTGLFNLDTKELFDHCQDFCIVAPEDADGEEREGGADHVAALVTKIAELEDLCTSLRACNVQALAAVREEREKSSNLMAENLLQSETIEAMIVKEKKRKKKEEQEATERKGKGRGDKKGSETEDKKDTVTSSKFDSIAEDKDVNSCIIHSDDHASRLLTEKRCTHCGSVLRLTGERETTMSSKGNEKHLQGRGKSEDQWKEEEEEDDDSWEDDEDDDLELRQSGKKQKQNESAVWDRRKLERHREVLEALKEENQFLREERTRYQERERQGQQHERQHHDRYPGSFQYNTPSPYRHTQRYSELSSPSISSSTSSSSSLSSTLSYLLSSSSSSSSSSRTSSSSQSSDNIPRYRHPNHSLSSVLRPPPGFTSPLHGQSMASSHQHSSASALPSSTPLPFPSSLDTSHHHCSNSSDIGDSNMSGTVASNHPTTSSQTGHSIDSSTTSYVSPKVKDMALRPPSSLPGPYPSIYSNHDYYHHHQNNVVGGNGSEIGSQLNHMLLWSFQRNMEFINPSAPPSTMPTSSSSSSSSSSHRPQMLYSDGKEERPGGEGKVESTYQFTDRSELDGKWEQEAEWSE